MMHRTDPQIFTRITASENLEIKFSNSTCQNPFQVTPPAHDLFCEAISPRQSFPGVELNAVFEFFQEDAGNAPLAGSSSSPASDVATNMNTPLESLDPAKY